MFQKPHVEIKMRKLGDIEQNNGKGVQEFYKMSVCVHTHTHNYMIIKTEYLSHISHCIGTLKC